MNQTFSVKLDAAAGQGASPQLEILSPGENAFVYQPSGDFQVSFSGRASPPNLAEISIQPDFVYAAVTKATPRAANDFSEWTASVIVPTEGVCHFTVTALGAAGVTSTRVVSVWLSREKIIIPGNPKLILVEHLALSSFLGTYGAGRVISTFSLLPGEKTNISIRTFARTESDRKQSTTILDSVDDTSETDFEDTLTAEQSNQTAYAETFSYSVGAQADASWGWGSASVSAQESGSTNASRQDMAKNVTTSVDKHASKRSAKREVTVNTESEEKTVDETETTIVREIQNVNLSRTLNFIFRQMNQEYVTILHLTDVRLAYVRDDTLPDGTPVPYYAETALSQLDTFLNSIIADNQDRALISKAIRFNLDHILDYDDKIHSFVEDKAIPDSGGGSYLRLRKPFVTTYTDPVTKTQFEVDGIILAVTSNVLRTDGIIVDSLLGQGDALDDYSAALQQASVEAKQIENQRASAEARRAELANSVVSSKDDGEASVYAKVFG